MTYTPRQMIEALDLIKHNNPDEGERFEAIGLSNMSPETADTLIIMAQLYGYAL